MRAALVSFSRFRHAPLPSRARPSGNLHAFCSACSYANGTVNPYCAATVKFYNSFEMDARVMIHADDFWCRGDVLDSIAEGVDSFAAKFGTHKSWWSGNNTGDYTV